MENERTAALRLWRVLKTSCMLLWTSRALRRPKTNRTGLSMTGEIREASGGEDWLKRCLWYKCNQPWIEDIIIIIIIIIKWAHLAHLEIFLWYRWNFLEQNRRGFSSNRSNSLSADLRDSVEGYSYGSSETSKFRYNIFWSCKWRSPVCCWNAVSNPVISVDLCARRVSFRRSTF